MSEEPESSSLESEGRRKKWGAGLCAEVSVSRLGDRPWLPVRGRHLDKQATQTLDKTRRSQTVRFRPVHVTADK